jgi:hypothetical protein
VWVCGDCGCGDGQEADAEESGVGATVDGENSALGKVVQLINKVDAEAELDDAFSEVEECSSGAECDGGEGEGGNQDEEAKKKAEMDLHNFL